MRHGTLFFVFTSLCFNNFCNAQANKDMFFKDSIRKNEKIILNTLMQTNDQEINLFLKKRKASRKLRYVGIIAIPAGVAGVGLLVHGQGLFIEKPKSSERTRFEDGSKFCLGLGAVCLLLNIRFHFDSKEYYKKAMEKYILLNH